MAELTASTNDAIIHTYNNKAQMKTNREKNTEHDNKEVIRPKDKSYDFKPLEEAIKKWFVK